MAEYGFILVLAFIFFVVRQMRNDRSESALTQRNNQRDTIQDINFDNFNPSYDQERSLSKNNHPTRNENLKSNDNEHSGN